MTIQKLFLVLICLAQISLGFSEEKPTVISLMTYNVENLFDTKDDIGKDDKAFLPASMKRNVYHQGACQGIRVKKWREECLNLDWNEDAKNNKILNIVKVITSFDSNGADIVAFQEIENLNVLKDLFKLLEPYGYKDHVLLEGKDYRGIDSAVVSKFPIKQSKLHYVKFSPGLRKRDTRPILEAKIDIFGTDLIVYIVHFPAPFLDAVLRKESFNSLEGLLNSHDDPAIAMGDFNVTTEEELELNTFQDQSNIWFVSHHEGCEECRGTYYYEPKDDWSFLDVILISKGRKISFKANSIDVLINETNGLKNSGIPKGFDAISMEGVSDHFPVIAKVKFPN